VKPFTLHADAEKELHEAAAGYDERRAGLGGEFLAQFAAALERVRQNPQMYAADEAGVRYCPLRRFPYTLVYLRSWRPRLDRRRGTPAQAARVLVAPPA
jgi:hypothetical protein